MWWSQGKELSQKIIFRISRGFHGFHRVAVLRTASHPVGKYE